MQEQSIRSYVDCNGFRFLDVMCEYCGKILTVDSISECADGSKRYIMREPAIGFGFTDDMIEGRADESQDKMVSLSKVIKWLQGNTVKSFDNKNLTMLFGSTIEMIEDFRKTMEE